MKKICAWCRCVLQDGPAEPVSHGICAGCAERYFKEEIEMKKIRVTVKGGKYQVETTGYAGTTCQEATARLEKRLGVVLTDALLQPSAISRRRSR